MNDIKKIYKHYSYWEWTNKKKRYELFIDALPKTDGAVALDVGCGSGALISLISGRCTQIYGVDISESLLRIAKEKHENLGLSHVKYVRACANKLPFADGTFSLMTSYGALHEFDLHAFTLEAERVLVSGGTLYIFDYIEFSKASKLCRLLKNISSTIRSIPNQYKSTGLLSTVLVVLFRMHPLWLRHIWRDNYYNIEQVSDALQNCNFEFRISEMNAGVIFVAVKKN